MWTISKIARLLFKAIPPSDGLIVEGTLYLDDQNAPEPDIQLFAVPEGTPAEQMPLPILVIEVSDTTYRRDSGSKLRMYAKAGIEDCWIVNLREHQVEVYRKPCNPTGEKRDCQYASVAPLKPGETISILQRPRSVFPWNRCFLNECWFPAFSPACCI